MNIISIILTSILLNNGWTFSKGSAESMQADFGHGTEYFTYITKARSNGENHGPIMPEYDDSGWQQVNLPHDWAVDLPFSGEASHSHGYKCIGWKYPQNSVGWYRKRLQVPKDWQGKRIYIEFDGIYRDSQVFCNGYFLGGRKDGYLQQVYDLSDYLEYGEENLITVRADASLEEGWYYEGAGIYRDVHLHVHPQEGILPHGVKTLQSYSDGIYTLQVELQTTPEAGETRNELLDAEGHTVASGRAMLSVSNAHEWSIDDPYLYTLRSIAGEDTLCTRIGLRRAEFSADRGFLLNGEKVILKGCDLHQDHAGVGTGIPTELWRYKLEKLRSFGFNAIRSSHNPASPAMLDLLDEMGFVIIDETREFGTNPQQTDKLRDMILRDINHPCVILWSIGNEEWGLEWKPAATRMAEKLCAYAHSIDPSRLCTYGNSGGRDLVKGVDVLGYNYIVQNPILEYRERFPEKTCVGTEETSGCGTRGRYETVPEYGWMRPINRSESESPIERGWKFYHENEWTGGVFYWTGFDYRGEPNPMVWPATGSQFGILDYCGFPKDEAFYLKSWWTSEPVLHICGQVDGRVWVYSNCSEVELFAGRKSLGRKAMPQDGHLEWEVPALREGERLRADAYYRSEGSKKQKRVSSFWPQKPARTSWTQSAAALKADGQDVVVIDIESPEATLAVSVENAQLLGWGNGDPGFKAIERPQPGTPQSLTIQPFEGCCQLLVRSLPGASGSATVSLSGQIIAIPYL